MGSNVIESDQFSGRGLERSSEDGHCGGIAGRGRRLARGGDHSLGGAAGALGTMGAVRHLLRPDCGIPIRLGDRRRCPPEFGGPRYRDRSECRTHRTVGTVSNRRHAVRRAPGRTRNGAGSGRCRRAPGDHVDHQCWVGVDSARPCRQRVIDGVAKCARDCRRRRGNGRHDRCDLRPGSWPPRTQWLQRAPRSPTSLSPRLTSRSITNRQPTHNPTAPSAGTTTSPRPRLKPAGRQSHERHRTVQCCDDAVAEGHPQVDPRATVPGAPAAAVTVRWCLAPCRVAWRPERVRSRPGHRGRSPIPRP